MKKNYIKQMLILAIMLMGSTIVNAQWTQIGSDIDGEDALNFSGRAVSLSADGLVVAIGAYGNDDNGQNAGHVRVYEKIAGNWIQIGSDIDGESFGDQSGSAVSLNSDGTVVAIGAPKNEDNGGNAGHVRVYQYNAGNWIQIGIDIDGGAGDNVGTSVSLSTDGTVVAIGAPGNSGGHVRIYYDSSGTWTQIGSDIDGEASGDGSGNAVSLSSDGTVVAIGAEGNDGNGSNAGHVRVYQNNAGTWTQIGSDIDGEAAGDYSGISISLSPDGSVVAIGATYNNNGSGSDAGHTRIYKNISGTWTQEGADIDGEATDDYSGWSVSLNSDGSIVAIGAYGNDGNGTDEGHVRIYQNNAGTWVQIGSDIDGEATNDWSGTVSLSAYGSMVAIGAYGNTGARGHVRVYTNPSVGVNELNNIITISLYPNPTKGKITVDCKGMKRVEVLDVAGQLVYEIAVSSNVLDIDISGFSKGVYFVKVSSEDGVGVERIVLE